MAGRQQEQTMRYASMAERLKANCRVLPNGCWEWTGKRAGKEKSYAYITFWQGGKHVSRSACRVSYETFVGPIPKGHDVRHVICHFTLCINPEHLAPGTRTQNMLDRTIAGRKGNKITPADVKVIRADPRTQALIAANWGINQSMVSKIKLRRNWKDVP
jgi:hypothetical protein